MTLEQFLAQAQQNAERSAVLRCTIVLEERTRAYVASSSDQSFIHYPTDRPTKQHP